MRPTAVLTAATLIGSSLVAVGAQLVFASAANAGCPPEPRTYWKKSAVSYKSIGPAAGQHNAGSKAVTLTYSQKTETTASTSVSAGASFSVSAGIAEVKAELKVTVTKSYTKGRSVTAQLSIPAHKSGALQPKAQFTRFTKYYTYVSPQCRQQTKSQGSMSGITKVPFFASCVGTAACTPKP